MEPIAHDNSRFRLRAFQTPEAVCTAVLLASCDPAHPVGRDVLRERWRDRFPRHADLTGRRGIAARLGRGLLALRAAGALSYDTTTVRVLDPVLLALSASNHGVVTTDEGASLPPSQWATRPAVPADLDAVADSLAAIPPHPLYARTR